MTQALADALTQLKRDAVFLQQVSKEGLVKNEYVVTRKMPPPVPPHQKDDVVIWAYDGDNISGIPRERDFFVFQYIYKGYVYENINGRLLLLQEGDTFLAQPNVRHCVSRQKLSPVAGDTCVVYFAIKKELCLQSYLSYIPEDTDMLHFFINPLGSGNIGQYMVVKGKKNVDIRRIIENILLEYTRMDRFYTRVLDGLFVTLISLLARNCTICSVHMQRNNVISPILNFLRCNYAGATLKETAEKFNYHPNYLCALLRKETGKNFTELVRGYRLEKACLLLNHSDLPVSEVASLVGYSNISHFYRIFKEKYKVMPSKFRTAPFGQAAL